ncbi:D-alanine--D-alanine ligase [Alistipes indistinctus]|jgi:D-ala D-ala ligase N-terminal domain protein|uniref:D-alanine--D-alanine ligase n=1 Tax=Alistipes indistinctus TaxID=626932 RepID=UPI0015F1FEE9|nr:D-alanine--D-alanine ligase [Alistipes indistinctus]BCG55332.1 D-alanine--D-alanine ligase [Alistipes indistinctus]
MVRNIALLTGGDSSEWQIALQGAENIGNALDRSRYSPYTIVLRNGHWTYTAPDGTKSELDRNDFTLPVAGRKIKLDYALIVIHGTPGEDGRLQGYLDMMGIPYSSCGFVSSVLTFDKAACKRAVAGSGIHLAKEILLNKTSEIDPAAIIAELGLPLFVKPNASGSSFGVTKVKKQNELLPAITEAFKESDQVLMEEFIEGREISCGVMIAGGKEYIFPITELVCQSEFFDYKAKYQGFSNEITPADLPEAIRKEVNRLTLIAYKRLNCRGVVRIDFIVKGETPYMIEINTIPGMSSHSIIPQQAATMGMSLTELFNLIIDETSNK